MPTINQREYWKITNQSHPIEYASDYRYEFESYTGDPVFARNLKDLTRRIGQDVIDQQKAGALHEDMAGDGFPVRGGVNANE